MIPTFLQGVLLGYGAAIPLGPINILIANYALNDYKKAFVMGLGAMSADLTYLLFIMLGISSFLENTFFITVVTFLGSLFLLYLAFITFKNRHQVMGKKRLKEEPLWKIYLKGYSLTLFNPYTVGFWISISTIQIHEEQTSFLILGLILSIISWITIMPWMIYKSKDLLSAKIITTFSQVSAVILAGFGILLMFRLL